MSFNLGLASPLVVRLGKHDLYDNKTLGIVASMAFSANIEMVIKNQIPGELARWAFR
jgi:hypothetical protein